MATKNKIIYEEEIYPAVMAVHRGFQFVIENKVREIPTMVCIWFQGKAFVAITWHSLQ
jgi:hypothetical protein